ncbi:MULTISPECIES: LysE family translocator [Pseudomonadaceae]|jgi:threonine/homoserine/homoserine lactone efflux protein|uniref:LysE family translocator n=1 Tax=Pseudomonadaceae TaxID=135621 RepID=UPI00053E9B0D|nr:MULTISPECIES: LysE family translocator [Pseudomonas]ELN4740968.1 LysE family translocator [Escherichia coli]MBH9518532.1 LysE family translocator [Pseudomonas aeruginosa]MCO1696210.1 LysE family translocator [Pseudomonas aeruginosa]MCO1814954.1 LysE family translocator [Pseudomonas aeruginosa]MDD2057630.1 LysE family translocator [Pseudomonas putida]
MLDLTQVLTYSVALGIAAAIPGPGMAALVARSVSGGTLSGFCLLLGLILGDLTYLSFAVFGLAMIAEHFNALFQLVRWGAALYLCYLAWQFWFANHQAIEVGKPAKRKELLSAAISGLTITLGNPKTIAFYLALLPLAINLETVSLQTWALVLVPLTILVLLSVGALFIFAAMRIRHLLSGQRAQQQLFRGAATIMVAAAASMLIR